MKVEDVIELSTVLKGKRGKDTFAIVRFVDSFYEKFREIAAKKPGRGGQGLVISIINDGDPSWPSISEFEKIQGEDRKMFLQRFRYRMKDILKEIRGRSQGGFRSHYKAMSDYIGSGKAVLWWSYTAGTRKEKNGTTGSKQDT